MSTVSTFIQNAISLAARSMSDATAVLRWGDEVASVTAIKASSRVNQFGRGDSGSINEHQRFVFACDGLTLPNEYDSIRVDGVRRVVTSVNVGGAGANAQVGTSAPFSLTATFSIKFDDTATNLSGEKDIQVPALRIGGEDFDTLTGAVVRSSSDRVKLAVAATDWIAGLTAEGVNAVFYPNISARVSIAGETATMRVAEWSWIGNTMLITLRAGRESNAL